MILRRLGLAVALLTGGLVAAVVLFWFWLAVGVQLEGGAQTAGKMAVGAASALAIYGLVRLRPLELWSIPLAGVLIGAVWWAFVPASNDRDWVPELAHGVTATTRDGKVTLANVRNFNWSTPDTATPSWETRVVDPEAVTSVDLFTSVWGNPLIAHTIVSFGFADGQHVAFSAEIRREQGEVYSTLGGFVREFELILIAADERDIIHLRTDARGERVSVFPLALSLAARRAMFMTFVDFGNELEAQPEWYNTMTANCTTVPFRLVRSLDGSIPLDWRVLASGMIPGFLYDRGLLPPGLSLEQALARAALPPFGPRPADGEAYSHAIRATWRD